LKLLLQTTRHRLVVLAASETLDPCPTAATTGWQVPPHPA